MFNDLSGAAVLSPAGINLGVATEYVPAEPLKNVLRPFVNNLPEQAPSVLGPAIDFTGQMIQGEQVHHASIKTVAHVGTTAIGTAAGVAITAGVSHIATLTGVLALGSIAAPVGLVAGLVIGAGLTIGFDSIYENSIKDSVDIAKDKLIDVSKNVTKEIGNAFKGSSSNLNPALN